MKKSIVLLASILALSTGNLTTVSALDLGANTHSYIHRYAAELEMGKFSSAHAAAKALCADTNFQASLAEDLGRHKDDNEDKTRRHYRK